MLSVSAKLSWIFSLTVNYLPPTRKRTMWPAALILWLQIQPSRTPCVWATCWESTISYVLLYLAEIPAKNHSAIRSFCSFNPTFLLILFSITDAFEGFTLSLLSSLMISGPNAPFYKSLIEPKIGTDFSSVVGCVCRLLSSHIKSVILPV